MNAPQEKIPRKYTEKEEITLEENLTPEQRLMVCRVFKSVSTKGILHCAVSVSGQEKQD